MRVIIVTQDEPLYLGRHLDYLFSKLPPWVDVRGTVVLGASPFGKSAPFLERARKAYGVFGPVFFLRYSLKFIGAKLLGRKYSLRRVLLRHTVREIAIGEDINSAEALDVLRSYRPDVIVSIMANQIFKKDLLALPRLGCLNLHTARLPEYKGLMPVFWALKNGEKSVGVSVFLMDEGIDTGDIIVQKAVEVGSDDTLESVINKTKRVGMDAIVEALALLRSGDYSPARFAPGEGTYYSFPARRDVKEFLRAGKRFF